MAQSYVTCLALCLVLGACDEGGDTDSMGAAETTGDTTTGDGDGDASTGDGDGDPTTDETTGNADCSGDEGCLFGDGSFGANSGAIFCDDDDGELQAALADAGLSIQCTTADVVHVSFMLGWDPNAEPPTGTFTFAPGAEVPNETGGILLQMTLWDPNEVANTTARFNQDVITLQIDTLDPASGTADITVSSTWQAEPTVDITDPMWSWACSTWAPDGCTPGDMGCECSEFFLPINPGSANFQFIK